MPKSSKEYYTELLREAGLRITQGRIQLLETLAKESIPLSVAQIQKKIQSLDTVTLYRSLEALIHAGIVKMVDFRHPHAHYELVEGRAHHHHFICQNCDRVEDIEGCEINTIQKKALQKSKWFKTADDHSLEFFGTCKTCFAAKS